MWFTVRYITVEVVTCFFPFFFTPMSMVEELVKAAFAMLTYQTFTFIKYLTKIFLQLRTK